MKSDVRNEIINLLMDIFKESDVKKEYLESADLIDDFGIDSLNFICLVLEIESSFGITISDEMLLMDNFRTVDRIERTVCASIDFNVLSV